MLKPTLEIITGRLPPTTGVAPPMSSRNQTCSQVGIKFVLPAMGTLHSSVTWPVTWLLLHYQVGGSLGGNTGNVTSFRPCVCLGPAVKDSSTWTLGVNLQVVTCGTFRCETSATIRTGSCLYPVKLHLTFRRWTQQLLLQLLCFFGLFWFISQQWGAHDVTGIPSTGKPPFPGGSSVICLAVDVWLCCGLSALNSLLTRQSNERFTCCSLKTCLTPLLWLSALKGKKIIWTVWWWMFDTV